MQMLTFLRRRIFVLLNYTLKYIRCCSVSNREDNVRNQNKATITYIGDQGDWLPVFQKHRATGRRLFQTNGEGKFTQSTMTPSIIFEGTSLY